ncbi:DUF6998 domain-containing protein [Gluconacetobacter entanii]|uniref:DUF6998 domain-containing protein n=1 Tax=Gluconacetobacter entanii TaxID=108528 RepID=UPI001ABF3E86|nr:hypothetical protein [Gluconacetobacter entanii]MCE2577284.1 hypothetical protein [Komagataeibacter sp. FNDCR1]
MTAIAEIPVLIAQLYQIVDRLEQIVPGRKFTPDGHLVGSIGEAVAEYSYGLTLLPASFKQYDAIGAESRHVQIKLTQGNSVAISYACDHLLVLHLDRHKGFSEVYNGAGAPVWDQIHHKADHGRQRSIRLTQLRKIAALSPSPAIPQIRPFPSLQNSDHKVA